jgi:N-methylhydantoinase B
MDPIEFSVFLSRMRNVVAEMSVTLAQASMTPIIALAHDFSCCVYDVQARQIAVHDALPIQTSSMDLLIREVQEAFAGDIAPGDVMMCNDPYRGNTHVGDLVVLCPVFADGRHLFWTVARAHQVDVGAPLPNTTTPWAHDVWQEGLAIPPIKLYAAGERREDVFGLYLRNMRWPELIAGDLMAQVGSVRTGAARLGEICRDLGVERALDFVDRAVEYGARRTAAELRAMPAGTYRAEAWMDSDGAGRANVPLRASVTIDDGRVSIDFDGSAEQSDSGFNASFAVSQAAGRVPVIMAIDPDIPHNQGCLDAIEIAAPEGSIAHARFPAATGGATTWPGDLLQDVVWRALAEAIPERVRAGTSRWNNAPELYGEDDGKGNSWGLVLLNAGGGGGAAHGCDGWPLITSPAAAGGLRVASIEDVELLFPLLFEACEIEPDSMGFGRWNGGPGIRLSMRSTTDRIKMFNPSDALDNPPHGVLGGTAGQGGGSFVVHADGSRTLLPSVHAVVLRRGERWTGVSSGGGGYGDPLERDAEQVARDVRDGLITPATARDVHGVVTTLDAVPAVDGEATAARRQTLALRRSDGWDATVPAEPAVLRWIDLQAAPGDVLADGHDQAELVASSDPLA